MTRLDTLLACLPDAPFRQRFTEEITLLKEEREGHISHIALLKATLKAERAEKLREECQWQPIATAPKDGRTLLLGCFNALGNWRTMRGQWIGEDYIAEYWEDPDDAEPGWFETSVEADDPPNCWRIEPTHWMPLPEAPCIALTQQEQPCKT